MKTFIEKCVSGDIDCTIEELIHSKVLSGFTEEELHTWNNTQESLNSILLARIKQIPEDQWNFFQKDFVSAAAEIYDSRGETIDLATEEGLKKFEEIKQDEAIRYNTGKRQWNLVDMAGLEPMIEVLEFGATKYSPDNWRKGMPRKWVLNSLMRHVAAVIDGEEIDPESGLPHMGHIMCNAMFYVALKRDKWDKDEPA